MIAELVIASLLAGTSAASAGQGSARSADMAKPVWSHMHQCTLAPVSNFTVKNTGDVSTGMLRIAGEITMTRIDLQVTGSPGGTPTITAHAINTKGTGVTSGRSIDEIGISVKSKRMSSEMRNRSPIAVACVTSQLTGVAAAQKVDIAVFRPSSGTWRAGAKRAITE